MADTCRSSGVLVASAVIAAHQCRLKSIHFSIFAAGPDVITVQVYDSKDADLTNNTELARLVVQQSQGVDNIEYDMHGALAREGLFLKITNSAGSPHGDTIHAVSVEFN
tara:strand:+ start:592 stop:918 length:327 start_codon:yes stop_codon:yes gene_type:complete